MNPTRKAELLESFVRELLDFHFVDISSSYVINVLEDLVFALDEDDLEDLEVIVKDFLDRSPLV